MTTSRRASGVESETGTATSLAYSACVRTRGAFLLTWGLIRFLTGFSLSRPLATRYLKNDLAEAILRAAVAGEYAFPLRFTR